MLSHEEEVKSLGDIRLVGGESLVSLPVAFSSDSRNFFCCCGNKICVYSTETGELLRQLVGHKSGITGFSINSKNGLQLVSCCEDGVVIVWDYTDGAILKKYDLGFALWPGIFVHPAHEDSIFLVKQFTEGKTNKAKLAVFNTKLADTGVKHELDDLFSFTGSALHCVFSKKGLYIAFLHSKRKKLGLWSFKSDERKSFTYQDSVFTCLAFHPYDVCVAVGDQSGRIIIWQGFFSKTPATMELHWHAHQVSSLAFTHDGSYILSGGVESVLVLWQYRTHNKQFLPRLGAPIVHVACSPDDMTMAVSHKDNVVRLVSGVDLHIKHTIQGLRKARFMCKHLVFDPRTNAIVMNSMPGMLQFYSPQADKGMFLELLDVTVSNLSVDKSAARSSGKVDVVKQNYISQTEDEKLFFTQVEYVAFSNDGDWMATIEHRNDHLTTEETRLKFWEFNSTTQSYSINTVIDTPHHQSVVAVHFQPGSRRDDPLLAVTAGQDGRFKIWVLTEAKTMAGKKQAWACQSVGYYNDSPCISTVFSEDGKLLAVAYGQVITLWRPETNVLQKSLHLPHLPLSDDKIRSVTFGCQNSAHFLIVSTAQFLIVWDLLTCSVLWTLEAKVGHLLADPNTDYIAAFIVFKNKTHLYLFNPSSPRPVAVHPFISKKAPVFTAAFDPKSSPSTPCKGKGIQMSKLYFLTKIQELYTIDSGTENEEEHIGQKVVWDEVSERRTEFLKMFGQEPRSVGESTSDHRVGKALHGEPTSSAVRQMLSTPAHVLPPVTALCSTFLKSLLISKQTPRNRDQVDKEDSDSEDEDMDRDENLDSSDDDVTSRQEDTSAPVLDTLPMILDEPDVDEHDLETTDFTWLKDFFV